MMQSQNKSEMAMLAELVIAQGLKAEAAQKAQAEAQKAQAEAQKELILQIQKLEETLASRLDFITNDLDVVKSNTVTILNRQKQSRRLSQM